MMENRQKRNHRGFTLIELVIVITILAILAAVAIPAFQNLTAQARNSGAQGSLGGLRSAISVFRANQISNGCEPQGTAGHGPTVCWPTLAEVQAGAIMENSTIPTNPWCVAARATCVANGVAAASAAQATARTVVPGSDVGWLYYVADNALTNNGLIYANSAANGGGVNTENTF